MVATLAASGGGPLGVGKSPLGAETIDNALHTGIVPAPSEEEPKDG